MLSRITISMKYLNKFHYCWSLKRHWVWENVMLCYTDLRALHIRITHNLMETLLTPRTSQGPVWSLLISRLLLYEIEDRVSCVRSFSILSVKAQLRFLQILNYFVHSLLGWFACIRNIMSGRQRWRPGKMANERCDSKLEVRECF